MKRNFSSRKKLRQIQVIDGCRKHQSADGIAHHNKVSFKKDGTAKIMEQNSEVYAQDQFMSENNKIFDVSSFCKVSAKRKLERRTRKPVKWGVHEQRAVTKTLLVDESDQVLATQPKHVKVSMAGATR